MNLSLGLSCCLPVYLQLYCLIFGTGNLIIKYKQTQSKLGFLCTLFYSSFPRQKHDKKFVEFESNLLKLNRSELIGT